MHDQLSVGSVPILWALFYDDDGVATTPAAVTLTITKPDGTTIVKNLGDLTVVSAGHVEWPQPVDQAGIWIYTFVGSGNDVDQTQTEYLVVGVTLHAGPCDNWIAPDDLFDCGPCGSIVEGERDHGLAARMATAATEFYWMHSGRQFSGLCDITVRPCCHEMDCGRRKCGCPDPIMLALPRPTRGVLEVRQDGAVIPAASYEVQQHRWLVRTDGEPWPCCQDMQADPATDQNTLQIRLLRGTPPPELGVLAARELACELYRGCIGEECGIPNRVTNIARQGVTMQLIRPEELGIDATGRVRTGLKIGQLFLATYPGNKGRARPAIASPDSMPSSWRVSM